MFSPVFVLSVHWFLSKLTQKLLSGFQPNLDGRWVSVQNRRTETDGPDEGRDPGSFYILVDFSGNNASGSSRLNICWKGLKGTVGLWWSHSSFFCDALCEVYY